MLLEFVFAPVAAVLAIVFAVFLALRVMRQSTGTGEMKAISDGIREGAKAYLKRQYKTLTLFITVMIVALFFGAEENSSQAFILGSILSVAAGYFGMDIATKSNARTAEACRSSVSNGLRVAFSSGSVMGFITVGFGLAGICILYIIYGDPVVSFIASLGLGASGIALFARVGGGIFTKAADVGADLVGKVEAGIPEDDPRNAAVIADNVGDNVGDVAGMGADLLESYVSAIIVVMVLALTTFSGKMVTRGILLPMLIAAAGIVASIIGSLLVRTGGSEKESALINAIRKGVFSASLLVAVFSLIITYFLMGAEHLGSFYAIVVGLLAGILIGLNTEYYTLSIYKPTQNLAMASQTGAGTTLIIGMALGMESTLFPIVIICAATFFSYMFAGVYGIAIAGVGMLSTLGVTLATDAYGPVADNAAGIAEMAHLGDDVRNRAGALDELGNTTAATGKGYAIGSAALTTLGWIVAYLTVTDKIRVDAGLTPLTMSFADPRILGGIFIGGVIPVIFCAIAMKAVGRTAFHIVNEVRRQFREIKGLMEGKAKPEYGRCVDISTRAALKEMIIPGALAVVAPVLVGFILGPSALCAFLVGATVTGFLLAILMANAGGAWDNAKKYIESGHFGGKGSPTHKAAVVGDTVGDPFKDTAGPSLNILIKLMSKVALVFVPLFALL